MMMNSSSFESPMPYLFAVKLSNNIVSLLRYKIIAQIYDIFVALTMQYCEKVSIDHHCTEGYLVLFAIRTLG